MSWLFLTFTCPEGCETARRWLASMKREGRAGAVASFGTFKSRARWDRSPAGHCLLMLQATDPEDPELLEFLDRCAALPSFLRCAPQNAPEPALPAPAWKAPEQPGTWRLRL